MPLSHADHIEDLTILRLGAGGDGIAHAAHGQVFVPNTLPGEIVSARIEGDRAEVVSIAQPSALRLSPICPLFTRCGGCAVQHLSPPAYADWKQGLVAQAFERAGHADVVQPMIDAHGAGRRRVTFHARKEEGRMRVGFMAARSHDLIAIDTCPMLVRQLREAPAIAQRCAELLGASGKPLDVQITASPAGLDVDLRGHGPASDAMRLKLAALAEACDLARLSLHGDLIVERRAPRQPMGRAEVAPQPGGFLQATELGESTIAGLVGRIIGKARHVADLFAGCGPIALRLAQTARVHAVEGEAPALAALDRAVRHATGLKAITTEARDLFRRPLLEPELDIYDAVVLDPPRAGAQAQIQRLALSAVPVIAYVSCNLQTFLRDAALLVDAGYMLEKVTPVDQFRYSAHIELVAAFRRPRRR